MGAAGVGKLTEEITPRYRVVPKSFEMCRPRRRLAEVVEGGGGGRGVGLGILVPREERPLRRRGVMLWGRGWWRTR